MSQATASTRDSHRVANSARTGRSATKCRDTILAERSGAYRNTQDCGHHNAPRPNIEQTCKWTVFSTGQSVPLHIGIDHVALTCLHSQAIWPNRKKNGGVQLNASHQPSRDKASPAVTPSLMQDALSL